MPDQNDPLFAKTPQEPVLEPLAEDKSYYTELVGDQGKYRDNEALARAAIEKDRHIEKLEREGAILRTELKQRTTLEEFMERMTNRPSGNDTANDVNRQTPGSLQPPVDPLTPDAVKVLLQKELQGQREADRQDNNALYVRSELEKRYGGNWQSSLEARVKELGVTEEFAVDLARKQPKAFLALVGTTPEQPAPRPGTPPASSLDTSKMPPVSHAKNKKYYDALMAKDINLYLSPKVQNEMHAEAIKQGRAFYE